MILCLGKKKHSLVAQNMLKHSRTLFLIIIIKILIFILVPILILVAALFNAKKRKVFLLLAIFITRRKRSQSLLISKRGNQKLLLDTCIKIDTHDTHNL